MSFTKARSSLALAVRDGAPAEQVDELRRDMRAERLAEVIKRTVDAAPQLSAEQRERLAALLRPVLTVKDIAADVEAGGPDAAA